MTKNEFFDKVAEHHIGFPIVDESDKLLEVGFEYVCNM